MPSAVERLFAAAQNNDVDALKALLAAGLDVCATDNNGWTAFHVTALHNRVDALKVLLAAGVDMNAKNMYGRTALHLAAENNNVDALKVLLATAGVDMNAKNMYGWLKLHSTSGSVALHAAAVLGDVAALKVLLAAAGVDVNAKGASGCTVLHLAAQNNHVDALKVLLEAAGVDVNAKSYGRSALHLAAQKNHVDALKVLLAAAGVDVNAKDVCGLTALHLAARYESVAALQVLLAAGGVDVNAKNEDGYTALHLAAQKNHVDALKVLLAADGVDANAKDNHERTALQVAAQNGNADALKVLEGDGSSHEASVGRQGLDTVTPAPTVSSDAAPCAAAPSSSRVAAQPPSSSAPVAPPTPMGHTEGTNDADRDRRAANEDDAPAVAEWPGSLDALASEADARCDAARALLAPQDPNVRAALDRFVDCLGRLRGLEATAGQCLSAESTAELQAARAACVEAARVLTTFPRDTVPLNAAVAAAVAAFEREIEDFRRATAEIAAATLGDPSRASAVQAVHGLRRRIEAHDEAQSALAAEMVRQTNAFDGEAWAAELSNGQAEADAVLAAQAAWCGDAGLDEALQRLRHRDAMATKVTLRRREHGFAACNFDNKLPSEDAVTLQQRFNEAAEALAAAEERLAGAEAAAQEALLRFPGLAIDVALSAQDGAEATAEAVCEAARAGDLDMLQGILLREPSLAEHAEANGEALLHHGVRSGDPDVVRLVLSCPGVDPLRRSRDGTLALELAFGMPNREIPGLLAAPLMAALGGQRRNPQTPSAASVSSMLMTPDPAFSDVESVSEWNDASVAAVAPIPNFSRAVHPARGVSSQAPSSARRAADTPMESDRARTARTSATRAGAPVILDQVPPHGPADGPFHTMAMYAQRDHALPEHDAAWEDASMMPAAAAEPPSQHSVAAGPPAAVAAPEAPGHRPEHRRGHAATPEASPASGRVSPSGSSAVFGGASEYGAHTDTDDDSLLLVQLQQGTSPSAASPPSAGSQ